jgi:hypothetical protein
VEELREKKRFRFVAENCLWHAWATNAHPSKDGAFSGVEVASDGDNIYTTLIYDPNKVPGALERSQTFVTNSVTVQSGKLPWMDPNCLSAALWLGYAAECEFQGKTTGNVQRLTTMNFSWVRPDVLQLFTVSRQSSSITQITFANDGRYPIVEPSGKLSFKALTPPYDKGFVESKFEVASYEYLGGYRWPKRYNITYFSSQRANARIEVVAERIQMTHAPLAPATRVHGLTAVYDSRARHDDGSPASYFTTNFIYQTNTPEFFKAREPEQMKLRRQPTCSE